MSSLKNSANSSKAAHPDQYENQYELAGTTRLLIGTWRLIDPKISTASISSMFLGVCAATLQGAINIPWLLMAIIGILFLEAAKNASGDIFDFDSGADLAVSPENRSPFSGGKRVIVDGLMTRRQTIVVAAVFYFLGISTGLFIVFFHEPKILTIGAIGVGLAYFYNAPPVKLSYRGLGEFAVAITYGPLICCGTYLVLRHELPTAVVFLSIPLGILIAAFLVINEFPDRVADLGAGKKNLVVRLGEQQATRLFMLMIVTAYSLILLLPLSGLPQTVWLGFAGLPLGIMAAKRLLVTQQTSKLIPAQGWTLLSFTLATLGLGIGLLI